jgi:hypothetical protein
MPASTPSISASLIVRDEQRQLPFCLASLGELVDEIVVCDTGSTDATVAVAALGWGSARTEIRTEPWTDHFGQARNAALAVCTGDWVLSIDADEVAFADPTRLRSLLAHTDSDIDAYAVEITNSPGPDCRGLYRRLECKLFRRTAADWAGRVHERLQHVEGRPIAALAMPSDILRLRHDGYRDADVVLAKARRNARLCELELIGLASNPSSVDQRAALTLDLGRSYLGCQRTVEAAIAFAQVRALTGAGPHWLWATDLLARLAIDQHRPQDVLVLAHELQGGGAQPAYCDWLRAQALVQIGNVEHADLILAGITGLVDVGGNRLELDQVRRLQALIAGQHASC